METNILLILKDATTDEALGQKHEKGTRKKAGAALLSFRGLGKLQSLCLKAVRQEAAHPQELRSWQWLEPGCCTAVCAFGGWTWDYFPRASRRCLAGRPSSGSMTMEGMDFCAAWLQQFGPFALHLIRPSEVVRSSWFFLFSILADLTERSTQGVSLCTVKMLFLLISILATVD